MGDRTGTEHNMENKLQLPLQYLIDITENFSSSRKIGQGGFGVVYKGIDVQSGAVIAVKKLRPILGEQVKQFKNEANHLARVNHHNIVKLIGYCEETKEGPVYDDYQKKYIVAEKQEKLLCYEYLPNGSLDNVIFDESLGLNWQDRYKIIVGICQGLHYLHEGWDNTPIIHMDLKPSNILLDDKMEPKIADFGLSRLFGQEQSLTCTDNLMGSIGYMASEYWLKGEISTKSDIYSLGILILEIITGKKNHQVMTNKSGEHFIEDVRKDWTHLSQIASKHPSLGACCLQQVHKCIDIGLCCVEVDKERRPSAGQLLALILSSRRCIHKVDQDPAVQGEEIVAAKEINTKSSCSSAQMTAKIAIGVVALVLVLFNLNSSCSWVIITALKFVMTRATLFDFAIGAVVLVLVLFLQKNISSSWRRVILFLTGIVLAAVIFLLNSSSPWSLKFATAQGTLFSRGIVVVVLILYLHNISSPWRRVSLFAIGAALVASLILSNSDNPWVVLTLKVVAALVTSFVIGTVVVVLILYLLIPSDLWYQRVILFSTGVVLVVDVLILLNPSASWSWVVMTLKFFKIIITLITIGTVFLALILCLQNLSNSWQRAILFSLGAVLTLWISSSPWTWVVIIMIMKLVTLSVIGILVVYLVVYLLSLSSSWRWLILLAIGAVLGVVLVLLKASNPWSWVVMILKFVAALVTLFAIGIVAVYLVLYLLNLNGSWRRVILFTIGVALYTVLVLLNPSSPWSWVLMTLKLVMVAAILFPIGVLAAYLILHILNVKGFTLWLIYFFGMNRLQFLVNVLSRSWLRMLSFLDTSAAVLAAVDHPNQDEGASKIKERTMHHA